MTKDEFDVCGYCCGWAADHEGASPLAVRDDYPRMMRKVLRHKFGVPRRAAEGFIADACFGNWLRLHETDVERSTGADAYAEMLRAEVWYCSDRWSWDRVMRVQWLYMRLVDRCRRLAES